MLTVQMSTCGWRRGLRGLYKQKCQNLTVLCVQQLFSYVPPAGINFLWSTSWDVGEFRRFALLYCPAVIFGIFPWCIGKMFNHQGSERSPTKSTGLSSASGHLCCCLRNNYWTAETVQYFLLSLHLLHSPLPSNPFPVHPRGLIAKLFEVW